MTDLWVRRKHFYRVCAATAVTLGIVTAVYGPLVIGVPLLTVGVIWAILTP